MRRHPLPQLYLPHQNSIQNRTGTGANKVCRSVSRTGPARVPTKYVGQYLVQDWHGRQQSMQVSIQNRMGTGTNKVCRSVCGTWVPTKYAGQYLEQDRHRHQQSMQVSIWNTDDNKVCRPTSKTGLARAPTKYAGQHLAHRRQDIYVCQYQDQWQIQGGACPLALNSLIAM